MAPYKSPPTRCSGVDDPRRLGRVGVGSRCHGRPEAERAAIKRAAGQIAGNAGWAREHLRRELPAQVAEGFDLGVIGFSGAEHDDQPAGADSLPPGAATGRSLDHARWEADPAYRAEWGAP